MFIRGQGKKSLLGCQAIYFFLVLGMYVYPVPSLPFLIFYYWRNVTQWWWFSKMNLWKFHVFFLTLITNGPSANLGHMYGGGFHKNLKGQENCQSKKPQPIYKPTRAIGGIVINPPCINESHLWDWPCLRVKAFTECDLVYTRPRATTNCKHKALT